MNFVSTLVITELFMYLAIFVLYLIVSFLTLLIEIINKIMSKFASDFCIIHYINKKTSEFIKKIKKNFEII